MKMKNIRILVVLLILPVYLFAQEDSLKIDQKLTPYDLLSNYYIENFHPFQKGNFYVGLAFSVTDKNLTNTNYLIQKVVEGDRLDYDLLLKGGYYTGDYGMVIINLNYFQNRFGGSVFQDPDTVQSNTLSRGFAVSPGFRSSVPLTQTERLSFFTEFGFTLGGSNSLTRNVKNIDEVEKKFKKEFNFGVGLSPGITFFAMENFAFEVQLNNVLGYELNVAKSSTNEGPESKQVRQNVDFNINLLSLELGLAYYFGAGKNRKEAAR
ncbi:hypothetical protein SLH46_01975 [Draconibacterium sp. IB214405]|uniref:hypothetical protein n=1 Tax=Draconibacterium sp. IB214405 TaxID=3097352 RepID=UPI002A0D9EC3|nr:hypothetical protein [Draconibacterium sp. IB214405]MDX8337931.1 hypothetical protein [Draconibacterium sp. IB214405]